MRPDLEVYFNTVMNEMTCFLCSVNLIFPKFVWYPFQFINVTEVWLQVNFIRNILWHCVDVVRAYKGLLKEKEALEASLKALSIQQLEDGLKGEKSSSDIEVDKATDQEEVVERSQVEGQDCHTVPDVEQVTQNYEMCCFRTPCTTQ